MSKMPALSEPIVTAMGTAPSLQICKAAGVLKSSPAARVEIIDIRRAAVELSLKEQIVSMFQSTNGPRQLPTLLLYNERGLQLFEDVSFP